MKHKLLIILLLAGIYTQAQTPNGYTKINSRYDWLAGKFDSGLHVTGFCGVPVTRAGVWNGDGQIGVDTCNNRLYIYSNGWKGIAMASEVTAYVDSVFINGSNDSLIVLKAGNRYASLLPSGGGGSTALTGKARYAIDFPGYNGSNVYTGQFHPISIPFYQCFYETWVRVDSSGYIWSDGYGGSHDMLLGFAAGDSTVTVSGNLFDEFTGQSFGSWDAMRRGTVHHIAVAYTGAYVIVWIDGVPTQRVARTVKRQNVPSAGCGGGYFGGSDHQNAQLRAFNFRIYEFGLPFYVGNGDVFVPQQNFSNANNNVVYCVNEFDPNTLMVTDKSSGFYGMKHDGFRQYSVGGDPIYPQASASLDSIPQIVVDSIVVATYNQGTSTAPVGAKIWDAFERGDQTTAFYTSPSIDSTEGGSLGKKKYIYNQYGNGLFAGILNKYCYFSGTAAQNYVKVLGNSNDQDVRATFPNTTTEVAVDVLARVTDDNNKILARVSNGGANLVLYSWIGGVFTVIGSYSGSAISELKLIVSGTTATVYGDGVSRISGSVSGIPSSNYSGFGCNSAYTRVSKFEVY